MSDFFLVMLSREKHQLNSWWHSLVLIVATGTMYALKFSLEYVNLIILGSYEQNGLDSFLMTKISACKHTL